MALLDNLKAIAFEKVRRTVAMAPLALFGTFYIFAGLNLPPETGLAPAFVGIGLCYVTAFVALGSDWFWARWFASGLGWFGVMVGAFGLLQLGWQPGLAIYGGMHAAVVVCLLGEKMAGCYDLQEGWRTRWGVDEFGVARLKKTVTRSAMALPALILWALGPREGGDGVALLAAAAAVAGLAAVVRGRTWGLFGLLAASALASAVGPVAETLGVHRAFGLVEPASAFAHSATGAGIAALLLGFAVVPFARPVAAWLRRD